MTLHEKVTNLRERKGISQSELERMSGLSKGTITNWKKRTPNMSSLKKVANALDCEVKYLLDDEEEPCYYINDETRDIAQEIFENKELRMLFDVSRNASADKLLAYYNLIKSLKDSEENR